MMRLILLFFVQHAIKAAEDCLLSSKNLENSNCLLCKSGFYNSDLDGAKTFPKKNCIKKIGENNGSRIVYILPLFNMEEAALISLRQNYIIYLSLPEAFFNEELRSSSISSNFEQKIIFKLLKGDHYIFPKDLKAFGNKNGFFERSKVELDISPLYCFEASEEMKSLCQQSDSGTEIIFLKSKAFKIFVATKLIMRNIIINGIDLHLEENQNSCSNQAKICCPHLSENCDPMTAVSFLAKSEDYIGLINLEPIVDEFNVPPPEITLVNVTFENLVYIRTGNSQQLSSDVPSVLILVYDFEGLVMISNCTFSKSYFNSGILRKVLGIRAIYQPILSLLNLTQATYLQSLIIIQFSLIVDYNHLNIEVLRDISSDFYDEFFSLFSCANFKGGLTIKSNKILNSQLFHACMIFVANKINLLFFGKIVVLENLLFNNSFYSLLKLGDGSSRSCLAGTFVGNNLWSNEIMDFIELNHIKNFTLTGQFSPPFSLPHYSFIRASFSVLFITDCVFSDLITQLKYFLIEITSSYEVLTENVFILSKRIKGVFFSNETTYIKNLVMKNSSILLFSNININFQLKIESSIFENLSFQSYLVSKSFIILLSEGLFSMNNVTFTTVSTNLMLINLVRFLNASINQTIFKEITIFNNPIMFFFSFTECNLDEHQINVTFLEAHNISFLTKVNSGKICIMYCFSSESGKGAFIRLKNLLINNVNFDKLRNLNNLFYLDVSESEVSKINCFSISNAIILAFSTRVPAVNLKLDHFFLKNNDSDILLSIFECGIGYFKKFELKNCIFSSKRMNSNKAMGWNLAQEVYVFNVSIEAFMESGSLIYAQPTKLSSFYIENLSMRTFAGSHASLLTIITENQEHSFPWNDYGLTESGMLQEIYRFGIINSTFQSAHESAIVLLVQSQLIFKNCIFKDLSGKEGGLIKLVQKSKAVFFNISVSSCFSENRGGCFFVEDSVLVVINAKIINSSSILTGGCLNAADSNISLINFLAFNSSSVRGGIIFGDSCWLSIIKSNFKTAFATIYGAHIVLKGSTSFIFMTYFQEGFTSYYGASLYLEASYFYINSSYFIGCETREGILFSNQGLNESQSVMENVMFYDNLVHISSATLYLKDLNIRLNQSVFSNNIAKEGYLIHAFGSSSKLVAKFEFLIISGNTLNKGLFSLSDAKIYLSTCVIRKNSVEKRISFNIINSVLEIDSSLLSQSYSDFGKDEKSYYLIKAKTSMVILATSFLDMNHTSSCLFCVACQKIEAFKIFMAFGFNKQGGMFNLIRSSFIGTLLFASKNHALQGGVIYSVHSNISLEHSCLSEDFATMGSDIFTNSRESGTSDYLNISSCLFFLISGGSLNATSVLISLKLSVFLGGNSSYFSQGLFALNCLLVTMDNNYFGIFKNKSSVHIENLTPIIMNISIIMCYFNDSNAGSEAGAFLVVYGFNMIFIKSTNFSQGFAKLGGAIYIKPTGNLNSFVNITECLFKNNMAVLAGGAISSETLEFNCKDCRFEANKAPTGKNINYFPNKLILVSLNDIVNVKETRDEIISSYIENQFENTSFLLTAMRVKPGYPFSFATIIIDEAGNIQFNINDYRAQINVYQDPNLKSNGNHVFMNNFAKVINGIGIFTNVTLVGDTNTIIYAVVSLNIGHFKINATITVEVLKCSTGDAYQDAKCEKCPEKYYSIDESPEEKNSSCLKCPEKAICPGGNILVPNPEFWRKDFRSSLVLPCKLKAGCPVQELARFLNDTPYEFRCALGYEGNLCQACSKGFGFVNDTCQRCEGSAIVFILIVFSGIVIYLAFLYVEEKSSLKAKHGDCVPLIKILINHVSIFIILTAIKINWSDSFKSFLSFSSLYISTSPSTIYSVECFFEWDKEEKLYYTIIMAGLSPLGLTVIAIMKNLSYNLFKFVKGRGKTRSHEIYYLLRAHLKIDWLLLEFFKYISILFINLYPPILLLMFQVFNCYSLDLTADKYLTQVPWVICESDYHKTIRKISITFIFAWGVCFPFILLYSSRKILRNFNKKIKIAFYLKNEKANSQNLTFNDYIKQTKQLNYKIFVGYLTQGYKSHLNWWEITVFSRKLFLFCIASFSEEMDVASICGLSIFFLTNYLYMTLFFKPYCNESLNYFEVLSLLISISSIILGLISSLEDLKTKYNLDAVCSLVLVVLNLFFLIFWFTLFLHTMFKEFYKKFFKKLIACFSFIKLKSR